MAVHDEGSLVECGMCGVRPPCQRPVISSGDRNSCSPKKIKNAPDLEIADLLFFTTLTTVLFQVA